MTGRCISALCGVVSQVKKLVVSLIGISGFEKKIKSISSCSPLGLFFGPALSIEGGPVQTYAHCEKTVGRLAYFSHLEQLKMICMVSMRVASGYGKGIIAPL